MKRFFRKNKWIALVALSLTGHAFQACSDDDHPRFQPGVSAGALPNALVTVKQQADENVVFFQLDDSTTLLPVNVSNNLFGGKEVRALVNYDRVNYPTGGFDQAVYVNWIDSILTKSIAPDLGDQNDAVYGNDPVEIVNDWVTIAEDGYLTLRFRTKWGGGRAHYVNLLVGQASGNPYEVEFRHNAYGDTQGQTGDGLVAFRLDSLPDTEGETVQLTLKWNSFSGEKSHTFDYCTRRSTMVSTAAAEERSVLPLR